MSIKRNIRWYLSVKFTGLGVNAGECLCSLCATDGSRVKLQLLLGFGWGRVRCSLFDLESKKLRKTKRRLSHININHKLLHRQIVHLTAAEKVHASVFESVLHYCKCSENSS